MENSILDSAVFSGDRLRSIFQDITALADQAKGQRDKISKALDALLGPILSEAWTKYQITGGSLFRDLADLITAQNALISEERQALDLASKILLEGERLALERARVDLKAREGNPLDPTRIIADLSLGPDGKLVPGGSNQG